MTLLHSSIPSFRQTVYQHGSGLVQIDEKCLANLSLLEEAVIAAHGMEPMYSHGQRINWPSLQMLTLVLESGIADFIHHIELPSLQRLCIIFPLWCNQQMHQSTCRRPENNDDRGSASDDSEGMEVPAGFPYILVDGVRACYKEEMYKLSRRFPWIQIEKLNNYDRPDREGFDILHSVDSS
jgi:hypothetical protein